MKWPILFTKARAQPATGHWHDWKQVIADHCEAKCVYCAISEARFGGIRNFHIEHFRPKVRFPALENAIANLYLACAICNILKSDDWPAEPVNDHGVASYPDPASTDYNKIFVVSPTTYEVSSHTKAGSYLIARVFLNRAQLILERRLHSLVEFVTSFTRWAEENLSNMTDAEARTVLAMLLQITRVERTAGQARPYRDRDTKRPIKARARKKR